MPIRPEFKYLYPIDWPQVSHWVRFVRAKGRCQVCGRPHGEIVRHMGDGRWWDEAQQAWRDGKGRKLPSPALAGDAAPARTTRVVLAAAHLDHDPAHSGPQMQGFSSPGSAQRFLAAHADTSLLGGFGDPSHFTRVFTRLVDVSPGKWRRLYRVPAAPPVDDPYH